MLTGIPTRNRPHVLRLVTAVMAGTALFAAAGIAAEEEEDPLLKGRYVQIERVQLVLVPTTVVDKRGRPVAGLSRADFHLSEDGKPIEIEYFATDAEAPIAIAFLLDVSGSMREERKLAAAKRSITAFVNALGPQDRFGLIAFADRQVTWITEFTPDKDRFLKRLEVQRAFGQTALFDALAAAPSIVDEGIQARKAIVLFSDGTDNFSQMDPLRAMQTARQASVPIYAISFIPAPVEMLPEPKKEGLRIMERFSRETGGRAFAIQEPADLAAAMQRIQIDMRHQYVLGFQPPPRPDKKFRRIRVETSQEKLRVQCRTGYHLGP